METSVSVRGSETTWPSEVHRNPLLKSLKNVCLPLELLFDWLPNTLQIRLTTAEVLRGAFKQTFLRDVNTCSSKIFKIPLSLAFSEKLTFNQPEVSRAFASKAYLRFLAWLEMN